MISLRWFLPLGLALTSGCVPFGFPPSEVSVGAAFHSRSIRAPRTSSKQKVTELVPGGTTEPAFALKAGARPLGLDPGLLHRRFDFAGGYLLEASESGIAQGGYLAVGGMPYVEGSDEEVSRVLVQGVTSILVEPVNRSLVPSLGVRVIWEWIAYALGAGTSINKSGFAFGVHAGEAGIGLYTEGDLRWVDGGAGYFLGAGIQGQLPASAGFLFTPFEGL